MLKKWIFWWKAKNRHGIHSPFVYRFLDEGLYRKDLSHLQPNRRLLLAAVDHFEPLRAGASPGSQQFKSWLMAERPGIQWGIPPFDLYLSDSPDENLLQLLGQPENWHDTSVVFVGNLRRNTRASTSWQKITRLREVRVVLQTYEAGLLFFRRQQARQHFRIRI